MSTITEKYAKLKTAIGGNREKQQFEFTYGLPAEEAAHITPPSRENVRIVSELGFSLKAFWEEDEKYGKELEEALDFLLGKMEEQGVITRQDCERAEEILLPLQAAAKEYQLILAAHSHIDMNWMWSFHETVAVTLATFRSILNIMDQYPDFCFSQSQGAIYKIVEEYDPELMEEIKRRIREGRWEVTASSWVETDKNMPDGESLLRSIRYTREYLSDVWGVKDFDLDFSPDTFGHSGNIPEIDRFGEVKYFYHCRGNARKEILYRFQAPSGKELLTYREPNWYNGAITTQMCEGFPEIVRRSSGLKTGLVVYGVGDHGGGPTRRDVERALDMMTWKIYPSIRFGTIREYFREAEKIRDRLPVVKTELNFFSTGCYTTQSRIKRGNRRLEAALLDAEAMCALAGRKAGFPYAKEKMEKAWQNVLFTHFHDILPGSCVQDTREHAMGLYQTSMATANTQIQNAIRAIGEKIDTSSIPVDIDGYNSQSEGAGAGYGIENFIGVPSTERGSGRTRIFHIFNSLSCARSEAAELTVWDWTGDMRRLQLKDSAGREIPFQLLDQEQQKYWDHRYFRILADVTAPALGYTTIVLSQKEAESYPVYLQDKEREYIAVVFDDYELSNDRICATIDKKSGRISSLKNRETGEEMISAGKSAGITYLETESSTSDAWKIGRHIREIPADRCIKLERICDGPLRTSVRAEYALEGGSVAEVVYSLGKYDTAVELAMRIDWQGVGGETVPVLDYRVPLSYETTKFRYDIPAGSVVRKPMTNDVPGLKYGCALQESGSSLVLISDSKYGYRGYGDALGLTLINSATRPDPYPERGIHRICLWVGIGSGDPKETEDMACRYNHKLFYQPSNCHPGVLPLEDSLLEAVSDSVVISSVQPGTDGAVLVRGYEVRGEDAETVIRVKDGVRSARSTNLFGKENGMPCRTESGGVRVKAAPYSLFEAEII
ncbi:MAG: hypothetical protein NC432_07075 [Roseburia sp.]|nr:hypothetical protein [Roseburia sp.]MCM1098176.1 hypothetical protein [Ruminococcus flavefaciens]